MRYDSQMTGLPKNQSNQGMLPSGATTTNVSLSGVANPQAPIMSEPRTYNPGIKPTGAPVNFNPKAQATMTGMFGMPTDGSYDRAMNAPVDSFTMDNQNY